MLKKTTKHKKWTKTIEKEYESLMKNGTWELVQSHKHGKVISNMFVFVVRLKHDRALERYKSKLVAR